MKPRRRQLPRSFLLGAMAGAAFALLLAPASGRDTQTRVIREVDHAAAVTRGLGERVVRKGREALAGVAASLDRIAGR